MTQYYTSFGIPIRGSKQNFFMSKTQSQISEINSQIQQSNNSTNQMEKFFEKQKTLKQYQQYFKDVLQDVQKVRNQSLTKQILQKHRVTIIKKENGHLWNRTVNECDSYVELAKCLHSGFQCSYNVFIGKFFLTVNVLHLHVNSYQNINKDKILGKGSYGLVRKLDIEGKQIALKKISFLKRPINQAHLKASKIINQEDFANQHQIKLAVRQYSFYKICSMLKIGPEVIFEDCYDLVCYNDCVEFKMQLCQNINEIVELKKYERDIKRCLATLHSLKIIHKDIKKVNTLFSKAFNSYVLADFGLAHTVTQQIWQKTETNFSGTWGNASPEMRKIFKQREPSYINLYLNDIYGLKITLQQIQEFSKTVQKKYQKNIMSDYQSASQQYSQNYTYQDQDQGERGSEQETQKVENSYFMKSGNKYYGNQNRKLQQIISQRIDYYQIKIIYFYLNRKKKQNQNSHQTCLQTIIKQTIKKEEDHQTLKYQLIKLITPMLQPIHKNEEFSLLNLRNSIRIFGVKSKQFLDQLKRLCQGNGNRSYNCQLVKNYLKQAQKNNKIVIKKFDNHILNMYRHLCLRNSRSLSNSLRSLLKNYLEENKECKQRIQEILVMVLQGLTLQGLTQSDTFQFVQMLEMIFSRRHISVNKQNYEYMCVDLMQRLFDYLSQRNKVSTRSLQNMANFYISMRMDDRADKYMKKIGENIQTLKKIIKTEKNLQKGKEQELKIIISSSKLVQAYYQTYQQKFDEAYQNLIKIYNQFTEYQVKDQSLKLNILNNLVSMAIRIDKIDKAQFYNQLLKEELQNYCLPRKVSIQFSYYHLFEAQILKKNKRYSEAIQHLQRVVEQTNDPLRGPSYIKVVKQTYYLIADCYDKMGNGQKCLLFLYRNYEFSKIYQHLEHQQTIQTLHQILKKMINLKKSGQELSFYFYQITCRLVDFFQNSQFKITCIQKRKLLPLFNFSKCNQIEKDQDYAIMVRRISIQFVQNYLPLFNNWYITQNQFIYQYYNKKEEFNMACRYLWNILRREFSKNEKYYQNQQKFIHLLIKSNSSRRAYVYLKKHAFLVPQKFLNYKVYVFRMLNQLSYQLNTKDQSLYQFIWRYKAMKSLDNLMESQQRFQQAFPNIFIRKIYEKKLRMIQLQIEEKRSVVINMAQNYEQNVQQQRINRSSSVTTQDIIRRKLILQKEKRRQAALAY